MISFLSHSHHQADQCVNCKAVTLNIPASKPYAKFAFICQGFHPSVALSLLSFDRLSSLVFSLHFLSRTYSLGWPCSYGRVYLIHRQGQRMAAEDHSVPLRGAASSLTSSGLCLVYQDFRRS